MKHLIYLPLILFLISCASGNKLDITANPEGAEVFVSDSFLGEYRSVGKTPLNLDLKKISVKGKFLHLSVKAEKFEPYNIVLPKDYSNGKIKLKLTPAIIQESSNDSAERGLASVKDGYNEQIESMKYSHAREIQSLNEQLKLSRMMAMNQSRMFDQEKRRTDKELEEKTKKNVQQIFNKTFEIQNALQYKRLSKAGKALAELRTLDPPETLFLVLEGNFEFLNGRRSKALASYKRALLIDPTNLELVSIVRKLEKALNG